MVGEAELLLTNVAKALNSPGGIWQTHLGEEGFLIRITKRQVKLIFAGSAIRFK